MTSHFEPFAVGDVELTDEHPLRGITGPRPAYLTAHFHGRRVGMVIVDRASGRLIEKRHSNHAAPIIDTVVSALAREAAEDPPSDGGDRLEELFTRQSTRRSTDGPSVSLVVCTRDRPESVEPCLDALTIAASAPGAGRPEILVIDNAPRTNAVECLIATKFPTCRYIRETRAGLNRARNRAVAEAKGDVVAFTDDDVRVEPDWVERIRSIFGRNPEVGGMTGLVLPLELETEAQWWFEEYGGFARGFDRRWYHVADTRGAIAFHHANTGKLGTGANMAFRRDTFDRTGPFDPALDVGTATKGGGDLDMFFRTLKSGTTLVYEPAAAVRHLHRRSYAELLSQIESWGTGMSAYLARTARFYPEELGGIVRLRAWLSVAWFAQRYVLSFFRQPFPRTLILREFFGSFHGAELYAQARADAAPLGDSIPTPRGPRAIRLPSERATGRTLELTDPPVPLTDLGGAARVRLSVTERGRPLGDITIDVSEGIVGADRLRDAVATQFAPQLLGMPVIEARRRMRAALASRLG
jgi:GT2 family glycosyltransferase